MEMRRTFVLLMILFLSSGVVEAKALKGKYFYVKSGLDGFFYLKAYPKNTSGNEGFTRIFKVGERDELVDEYPWYTRGELFMGWSPIVGKVALIKLENEHLDMEARPSDMVAKLIFYLGGKEIRSYDKEQLQAMGLGYSVNAFYGRNGDFKVLGVQQIPGTNEYVFSVKKENGEVLSFDIITGEQKNNKTALP